MGKLGGSRLLTGESVLVLTPAVSYDEYNNENIEWQSVTVQNVVVAPATTTDEDDTARPHGTKAKYTLAFPKTFTGSLRGCRVSVRGQEFEVIGDPMPNTAENCPTSWWLKVEVQDVEG